MKRKITISESQIINAIKKVINEARRNPETNVDESFAEFYNRMIQKAPREDIFLSFREDTHVTDVNPANRFRTPTGFYSYPLSSFDIPDNPTEIEFRRKFPFGNDRHYLNFFILKNHDGILTGKTDDSTLDMYVERIKKVYGDYWGVPKLCDSFIANTYTSDYIDEDPGRKVYHRTHLFWLFLYDVAKAMHEDRKENRINLICRNIGVNGFVDYEGHGYIHSAEPSQAVFFRVKNLGEVFIYETPKLSGAVINNAIQNKEYKIVWALTDDINLIKLFDKYNLVNKGGELIYNQWFDDANVFANGFVSVKLNKKWGFINKNGELISKQWFDTIFEFKNGFIRVKVKDKWNLMGENGRLLSRQWFDLVDDFQKGLVAVQLDGKWNFINKKGELTSNQWFTTVNRQSRDGVTRIEVNGKGVNFINQNGEIMSEQWFDRIYNFQGGFAIVELDDKWNFIDQNGKILSKQWFDDMYNFQEGFAKVKLGDKWNFIDQNGKILSKQWFDRVGDFEDGVAGVRLNDKGNVISRFGNLISTQWFDYIGIFKTGIATVKLGDKWNFINQRGNLVTKQWFDEVYEHKYGIAKVKLNNKTYEANLNNNSIVEVK